MYRRIVFCRYFLEVETMAEIGGVSIRTLAAKYGTPLYLMKMTQLYETYKQGSPFEFKEIEKEKQQ